jgi:hypothetical protein
LDSLIRIIRSDLQISGHHCPSRIAVQETGRSNGCN